MELLSNLLSETTVSGVSGKYKSPSPPPPPLHDSHAPSQWWSSSHARAPDLSSTTSYHPREVSGHLEKGLPVAAATMAAATGAAMTDLGKRMSNVALPSTSIFIESHPGQGVRGISPSLNLIQDKV